MLQKIKFQTSNQEYRKPFTKGVMFAYTIMKKAPYKIILNILPTYHCLMFFEVCQL